MRLRDRKIEREKLNQLALFTGLKMHKRLTPSSAGWTRRTATRQNNFDQQYCGRYECPSCCANTKSFVRLQTTIWSVYGTAITTVYH